MLGLNQCSSSAWQARSRVSVAPGVGDQHVGRAVRTEHRVQRVRQIDAIGGLQAVAPLPAGALHGRQREGRQSEGLGFLSDGQVPERVATGVAVTTTVTVVGLRRCRRRARSRSRVARHDPAPSATAGTSARVRSRRLGADRAAGSRCSRRRSPDRWRVPARCAPGSNVAPLAPTKATSSLPLISASPTARKARDTPWKRLG